MQKSIQNALFCGIICLLVGILLVLLLNISRITTGCSFLLIGGGYLLYRRYVMMKKEQLRITGTTGLGLSLMVLGLLPFIALNLSRSHLDVTAEGITIILCLFLFVAGVGHIIRAYFHGHLSGDIHMTSGYFWATVFLITGLLIFVIPFSQ